MAEKLKPCPFCGGDVKIINAEELTSARCGKVESKGG